MPDSKRPSGPGQQKNAARADATTREEIEETIRERSTGGEAGRANTTASPTSTAQEAPPQRVARRRTQSR
jgi:hypothetical protein